MSVSVECRWKRKDQRRERYWISGSQREPARQTALPPKRRHPSKEIDRCGSQPEHLPPCLPGSPPPGQRDCHVKPKLLLAPALIPHQTPTNFSETSRWW